MRLDQRNAKRLVVSGFIDHHQFLKSKLVRIIVTADGSSVKTMFSGFRRNKHRSLVYKLFNSTFLKAV